MRHIFIVDDDRDIRNLMKKYLISEGYKVTDFSDGTSVFNEVGRLKPDLIVLDIMMPGIDGLDVLRKVRKIYEVPVIFVSARGDEIDRIVGLELGADDYLSKPFSPRELLVRIKNIFKRYERHPISDNELIACQVGDLELKSVQRQIVCNNEPLELTSKEFDTLSYLLQNANIPLTREQLLEKVWGYAYESDSRIVDDIVKRLRKKLKEAASTIEIQTVWGFGYKIEK